MDDIKDLKDIKINIVEYYELERMAKHLVDTNVIEQDIMDDTMRQIAEENHIFDREKAKLEEFRRTTDNAYIRAIYDSKPQNENKCTSTFRKEIDYISLTKLAISHKTENPSYVIQSWLRNDNTLAFLDLWEKENNVNYDMVGYVSLLEKKKTSSFTVTPKQWITNTKAIGIKSRQGKGGGTFAHPMIACEFATWLSPRIKMCLLKMSQFRDEFYKP